MLRWMGIVLLCGLCAVSADTMIWAEPNGHAPQPRFEHTSTRIGNELFVFGGTLSNAVHEADLHVLNVDTFKWTKPVVKGNPPGPTMGHAAIAWQEQIYVFFGSNGRTMTNRVYQLDPETFEWTRIVPHGRIPTPRVYHSVATVDNEVFVFGGFDGRTYLNDLHKWSLFDPATNTSGDWKKLDQKGVVPEVRAAAATALYGRKLYMFGGFEVTIYKNDFFSLDLDTLTWSRVHLNHITSCAMPGPRAMASMTLVGAKLVLYGGIYCASNGTCDSLGDVYQYDLLNGKMENPQARDPQPPSRYGHSATIIGSKVAVFGGAAWPNLYNDMYLYDVYDNSWIMPQGLPPYPRKQHSMNVFRDASGQNHLVVFGGKHGSGGFSSHLHFMDLSSSLWTHPLISGLNPDPRSHHVTVMKDNSTLVLFGGYDGVRSFGDVYEIDLAASSPTWSRVQTDGPAPAVCHGHAVATGSDSWLQFGGVDCHGELCTFYNDLSALSRDSLSWRKVQAIGNAPSPRASHSFVTVAPTKHLVFGGIGPDFVNHNDLYEFDEDSISWTFVETIGAKPTARYGHTAAIFRHKMIVFGGATCHGIADCVYLNDVHLYNPAKNTWSSIDVQGNSPAARVGAAAAVSGDIMYILGGATSDRIFGELVTIQPDASVPENTILFGPGTSEGSAGKNVKFFIQLRDSFLANRTVGGDNVTVTVTPTTRLAVARLQGLPVDVFVDDGHNGQYMVQYTTNVSDLYSVHISLNGRDVSILTTDVVADIPDPKRTIASGPGLSFCMAGISCQFQVDLFDQYQNKLHRPSPVDVQFVGPKRVTKNLEESGNGSPVLKYVPEKAGNYSVFIRIRTIEIAGSPFNLTVHPGAASRKNSRVEGTAAHTAQAGDLAVVRLVLVDEFGNQLVGGGDSVKARLTGPDNLACAVTDLGTGTFTISYTAVKTGTYSLEILLADQPLEGSPFEVKITNSKISPATTFGIGSALRYAVAGYRSHFTIQAADEFGNNMTYGGAKFNVLFVGPGDVQQVINMTDNGDGRYSASYLTTVAGDFLLSATLATENGFQSIHMSPFLGTIVAAGADPLHSYVFVDTNAPPTGPVGFKAVMGVHNYFHIQAVDRFGNKKTQGGEKFSASLEGPISHDAFIRDNGDGTYIGTYVAPAAGKYLLKVYYGNVAVNNTPISVRVRANFDVCPNSCSNRGECINNKCECYVGYVGLDCSTEVNKCPSNCMGNGACVNNTCSCYPGFSGTSCEIPDSVCPNDCSKHGRCVDRACICDTGFMGIDCSDNGDLCPDRCSGNGECVAGSCLCYPGFKGVSCNIKSKFCPNGCSGKGNCMSSGLCSCHSGWAGLDCTIQLVQTSSSVGVSLQPELPARLPRKV